MKVFCFCFCLFVLFIAAWAIFQLSGGCHHYRWLGNLGLCSALRAFKQGGIFIVPHLLRHGTSVYTVSSERPAPTSHSGVRTPQLKDHQIFEPDALTTAPTRAAEAFWYNVDSKLFTSWYPGIRRGHNRKNHIYMCFYWKKSSPELAGQIQSNLVQIVLG
jgi:hypothetical protein